MFKWRKCVFCTSQTGRKPIPRPSFHLERIDVPNGQEVVTSTRYYFHPSCLVEVLRDPEQFDYWLVKIAVEIEEIISQQRRVAEAEIFLDRERRELHLRLAREMYQTGYGPEEGRSG